MNAALNKTFIVQKYHMFICQNLTVQYKNLAKNVNQTLLYACVKQ